MKNKLNVFLLAFGCMLLSCSSKQNSETSQIETQPVSTQAAPGKTPEFCADSAYQYVKQQVDFGYRVPNTPGHKACGNYLADQLRRFGAKVYEQEANLKAYDGTILESKNIIGVYHPEREKRILLFAHWDTRPFSDHDPNSANYQQPLDGADDGASGVGALLEIARQINLRAPENIGIDIIFFDSEDYGTPEFEQEKYNSGETWCLGTQYWVKNPHVANYKAEFGILLDMVGAKDAVFYKEFTSMRYAARYVELIWNKARDLGYGKYFINADGGGITDDHEFVIKGRGIPCVDIINYDPQSEKGFGDHWHTQKDNMDIIDPDVLKAVGQTVLEIIYNKK